MIINLIRNRYILGNSLPVWRHRSGRIDCPSASSPFFCTCEVCSPSSHSSKRNICSSSAHDEPSEIRAREDCRSSSTSSRRLRSYFSSTSTRPCSGWSTHPSGRCLLCSSWSSGRLSIRCSSSTSCGTLLFGCFSPSSSTRIGSSIRN